ncbi:hypothetical protein MSG_03719 [Mycobacterium shigaense]|uniref:DUF222 domain-containing protein n=1 Tax=Mycobacterium shigaense TaxID=722731 RepID=A0A1Z4ELJ9_9MYCO|nr:hypothetical protein MSG_03719 [Mycobacterium shigaense]
MSSADDQEATAAFDALDKALDTVAGLNFAASNTRNRLASLRRCEQIRRRLPAVEHALINQLGREATPEELGAR